MLSGEPGRLSRPAETSHVSTEEDSTEEDFTKKDSPESDFAESGLPALPPLVSRVVIARF